MRIKTKPIREISVSRLRRMLGVLDLDPPYQREGGVWKNPTKSRLIDSIINGLDVPKLYFEALHTARSSPSGLPYQYAVIDGKQRIEAMSDFLFDKLELDESFTFYEDDSVAAGGMNLSKLIATYPKLSERFLDYEIPIVRVNSDSDVLIEEMFQRLNASADLKAAEKRNSISGQTKDSSINIAGHELLVSKSRVKDERYKYRELASKFLAIEQQFDSQENLSDTKADTLWDLFIATRKTTQTISDEAMKGYEGSVRQTLDSMADIFEDNDRLLTSLGTIVVYYLAFRDPDFRKKVTREALQKFEEDRSFAQRMPEYEDDYSRGAFAALREYNGKVQSTNDGSALTIRRDILSEYISGQFSGSGLEALDRLREK